MENKLKIRTYKWRNSHSKMDWLAVPQEGYLVTNLTTGAEMWMSEKELRSKLNSKFVEIDESDAVQVLFGNGIVKD